MRTRARTACRDTESCVRETQHLASLRGAIVYLQSVTLGAVLTACAYGGLAPAWPASSPEQDAAREADEAYYLSTAYVEQAAEAFYSQSQSAAVPQWGRFETVVTNAHPYDDPFEDVTLLVKLIKPDGAIVRFWGFYDGQTETPGGLWRIRFMPDQTGTWRYETRFSDGSGQTSGSFLCVGTKPGAIPPLQSRAAAPRHRAAWPPGRISAYERTPIWFGFEGGQAVLVRSFQVGDRFLADGDNPLTGQAWSCAQRRAFLDWARKQGYNMLSVPVDVAEKGWNTPVLWDAERQQPNPCGYHRLEAMLDDLAERGMLVYPVGGSFVRSADLPTCAAKLQLYSRYTLARLGCYWNLLLAVPALPLSAENVSLPTMPRVLEGPAVTDLAPLSRYVSEHRDPTRPLYAYDALWAGSDRSPAYSPAELRRCAYVLMMSAATINFADMDGGFDSGFSGTLDLRQKIQSRHDTLKNVWDYFDRIPLRRLKPHQDLVDTGYCLAEPGQRYIVYLERRGTVTVNIGQGSYQVAWINARDTNDVRKAGVIESRRALTSPQEQEDWLLSLVRVEIVNGAFRER
jgi:hypothetical protein